MSRSSCCAREGRAPVRARAVMSNKARTLEELSPLLSLSVVPELIRFTVREWQERPGQVLEKIGETFADGSLAVRSSSRCEDGQNASRAGEFLSLLDVPAQDGEALVRAIEQVVEAMASESGEDEFFVQRMVRGVRMSGVVFTRNQDTMAPYYIISYDDTTSSTNTVTSGVSNDLTTLVLHRDVAPEKTRVKELLEAVREVEALFDCDHLDIEFALAGDGEVNILQVRHLVPPPQVREASENGASPDDAELAKHLRKCWKKLDKLMSPHPHLAGGTTSFGVMPDWNPAEIIGVRPRKLALSLYRELVMDNIWAHQRYNYGYRDVRSVPLMVTFLGVPFIDIRASFNSFVPRSLPDSIADKLVDYYLSRLHQRPELHDKIEFDIVFSCSYPGVSNHLRKLLEHGFDEGEISRIEASLLELTNGIVTPGPGLFLNDMGHIERLKERYRAIDESDIATIGKIFWLTEDCKRYGTLPFAGVARSGFVAMQMLRSFMDTGVIGREEFDAYLGSLSTVSKRISADIASLHRKELPKDDFLQKYGHLRPGTYDILSQRYDENFSVYFSASNAEDVAAPEVPEGKPMEFPQATIRELDRQLREHGFLVDARQMLEFIKKATEGREYAKFVFSKSLSRILMLVEEMGARFGFSRDDMSYLDIRTVLGLYADLDHRDLADILGKDIETNRFYHQLTRNVCLPPLVLSPDDVYCFDLPAGQPNFVSSHTVEADVVREADFDRGITGRVAMIASADPGYDWIFAKKPAGLVTMYGGANSHMAIRCAELGLPAVIGAGEANFNRWSAARRLRILCVEQKVRVVL